MTTGIVAGKVWGETISLFEKNNVEVHRISVMAGGTCSMHCHKHKHNAFYIEKGALLIEVEKADYDLVDKTVIKTGQMTSVPPGEYHRFVAIEDTIAYEIYWVELSNKDIVRRDHGHAGDEPNEKLKNVYMFGTTLLENGAGSFTGGAMTSGPGAGGGLEMI